MNVNSPYEEGIAVLSQDADGKSMLSFMLTPTESGAERHFTSDDCFAVNNEDTRFASNAIDMVQSSGSLIIACQGAEGWQSDPQKGRGSDVPTIYYLNEKTLVAENILTVSEYDDFKPTRLIIPSVGAEGVAYPILCENGSVYEFSTTEGAISKPTKLQSKYAQTCTVHDDGGMGWEFELISGTGLLAVCVRYTAATDRTTAARHTICCVTMQPVRTTLAAMTLSRLFQLI